MAQLPHLELRNTATAERYIYPRDARGPTFSLPARDRQSHGRGLQGQLGQVIQDAPAAQVPLPDAPESLEGVTLEFVSNPGFQLKLESLERLRSGIEVLNVRIDGDVMQASVFVPHSKLGLFFKIFERYVSEDTQSGRPKHQDMVESIAAVRLAALESLWTDQAPIYPSTDEQLWWEVWLRDGLAGCDTFDFLRAEVERVGMQVREQIVRFPERLVILVWGTLEQWSQCRGLFSLLAELRRAKEVPTEYVQLPARDQAEFINHARERLTLPAADAPAVCLLDTGVNRGHPLLEPTLHERDWQSADPNWTPADRHGHGTEMAGLAQYGDLAELLHDSVPVTLGHRLESVKILPDEGENAHEHWGAITSEAVARTEIAAPTRNRAICLTVTADERDGGQPSTWSAELDQICAGVRDEKQRLVLVSAGNVPHDERHEFPDSNHARGIEDPGQSWNALTVGACTERAYVQAAEYDGWRPVARAGQLCPASRTSMIWGPDSEWPFKPDIVMEGGNSAIDPSTSRADHIDDLALLTTHFGPGGTLLTTTGDTSAATALAARLAAQIEASYPRLWPETVRALMVHSAEWTHAMLQDFTGHNGQDRWRRLLRCFGYGVPDLQRALWSAENVVTLLVQGQLQPFERGEEGVRTKDMDVHQFPWPAAALQGLGEEEVTMRATLSYFIEPSPGRRGWDDKHRYQSHGLRFRVKRPTESLQEFRERLSRAAREQEEPPAAAGQEHPWRLGVNLQTRGSIQSDQWMGTAADVAACPIIGVYPTSGWWRYRPHLQRWNRLARYALVVTLATQRADVDLYAEIANQVQVVPEIET